MSSETATNSLIDFDNFDPFAPAIDVSPQSNSVNPSKVGGNSFSNDPFSDTFEVDDWQTAMQNISTVNISVGNSSSDGFNFSNHSGNTSSGSKPLNVSSTTVFISSNKKDVSEAAQTKYDIPKKQHYEEEDEEDENTLEVHSEKEEIREDQNELQLGDSTEDDSMSRNVASNLKEKDLMGFENNENKETSITNEGKSFGKCKECSIDEEMLVENMQNKTVIATMQPIDEIYTSICDDFNKSNNKVDETIGANKFLSEVEQFNEKREMIGVSKEIVHSNLEENEETEVECSNGDSVLKDLSENTFKIQVSSIIDEVYEHSSKVICEESQIQLEYFLESPSEFVDDQQETSTTSNLPLKTETSENCTENNEIQTHFDLSTNQNSDSCTNLAHYLSQQNVDEDDKDGIIKVEEVTKCEDIVEHKIYEDGISAHPIVSNIWNSNSSQTVTSMKSHDEEYKQTNNDHIPSDDDDDDDDDEQFTNIDFIESRHKPEKGLAGLKNYEHSFDDEFSIKSSPTSNQKTKDTSAADKVSSMVFNYGSAVDNICKHCNKRVYEMEKITVDLILYHKSCFRCFTCGRTLNLGNYSANDGQMYCKTDFMKNFKAKGSYTFSSEPLNPVSGNEEGEISARNNIDEETPVVPIKYMKNLFEKSDPDMTTKKSERSRMSSQEISDSLDRVDSGRSDVVVSSNVYVLEEELPPPSLAKNIRSLFENKVISSASQQSSTKTTKEKKVEMKQNQTQAVKVGNQVEQHRNSMPISEKVSTSSKSEEAEDSDKPQAGITRSLLARWRDMEENTEPRERSRGRDDRRNATPTRRSQSTSRVEISQRLKVVSDDTPPLNTKVSKEDGNQSYDYRFQGIGAKLETSTPAPKTFKWQVKEAISLNRPCAVHGDLPKYQPLTGDVISEKTPISEINRDEPHQPTRASSSLNESDDEEMKGSSLAKGSYVTEIKEDELPDSAAVKSAMMRFKSMEDPTKEPPVPKKLSRMPSNQQSHQVPGRASPRVNMYEDAQDGVSDEKQDEEEEFPASGTTRNLMAKFQSFQSK